MLGPSWAMLGHLGAILALSLGYLGPVLHHLVTIALSIGYLAPLLCHLVSIGDIFGLLVLRVLVGRVPKQLDEIISAVEP